MTDYWITLSGERIVQSKVSYKTSLFEISSSFTYSGFGEPNIIVSPVSGTLHEGFLSMAADGGSVGFTQTAGELEPAEFNVEGAGTTEIQELKWQDGRLSLTLETFDPLTGYVLDFFDVDGAVSLSLGTASATADTASDTLFWPVAEAPWSDGDYLMLRIRETGSAPISLPTPTRAPTPTPTPTPTITPLPGAAEIAASLAPEPAVIAVGATESLTLSVRPSFLGLRVQLNAATDSGNLSLNGECPETVDAGEVYFGGQTVQLLGCTAGTVSVELYQGGNLWSSYTVTVEPAATPAVEPAATP